MSTLSTPHLRNVALILTFITRKYSMYISNDNKYSIDDHGVALVTVMEMHCFIMRIKHKRIVDQEWWNAVRSHISIGMTKSLLARLLDIDTPEDFKNIFIIDQNGHQQSFNQAYTTARQERSIALYKKMTEIALNDDHRNQLAAIRACIELDNFNDRIENNQLQIPTGYGAKELVFEVIEPAKINTALTEVDNDDLLMLKDDDDSEK